MFFILFSICLILFYVFDEIVTPRGYPKGPTRLPLIGSYLKIRNLRNKLGFYHLVWAHLAKKYGPVFSIKFGQMETVVVSGYDLVKQVLCHDDFDARPDKYFFRFRAFYQKLGIVFVDGPGWLEQKKFNMHHIRSKRYGTHLMEVLIYDEVDKLILNLNSQCENGKPIKVSSLFDISVFNGLWILLVGHKFELNDTRLKKLLELVHASYRMINMSKGILYQIPFIRYFAPKRSGYKNIKQISNEFYTFLKELVDENRDQIYDPNNFIGAFLMEIDQNRESSKSFSEEQFLVLLLDLFLADTETTSSMLTFVILNLIKHPDVQAKVYDELDSVIGQRNIHLEDQRKLNYLTAVLMEVQRYSNVAPLAIAYRAVRNTHLQDFIIPEDTMILASIWSVHMDIEHWGDPESFRPERFLNSNGKIVNDTWRMPFGLGSRRCLGEPMGKATLFLFIAKIVQQFELKAPRGVQLPDKYQEECITISPSEYSAIFIPRPNVY